jgi:hypothetical protein
MAHIIRTITIPAKTKKLKKIQDEKWKEIPGSKAVYYISNYGRLKSFYYDKEGEIIKGSPVTGYKRVGVRINGKSVRVLVHRLVAEVWVPKPAEDCVHVIHLDWNKKNCQASNLAWVNTETLHKRMFDEFRRRVKAKGGPKRRVTHSKTGEEKVARIKLMINLGVAQYQIAEMYGITATQVKRIARGENWKHVKPANPDEITDD